MYNAIKLTFCVFITFVTFVMTKRYFQYATKLFNRKLNIIYNIYYIYYIYYILYLSIILLIFLYTILYHVTTILS